MVDIIANAFNYLNTLFVDSCRVLANYLEIQNVPTSIELLSTNLKKKDKKIYYNGCNELH